jgi:putative transcriptional regulator
MTIWNDIKELRQTRGVTQEELAKAVGVSRQTVVAMEKGNYVPSLLLALHVAEYFHVPVETVFRSQK